MSEVSRPAREVVEELLRDAELAPSDAEIRALTDGYPQRRRLADRMYEVPGTEEDPRADDR